MHRIATALLSGLAWALVSCLGTSCSGTNGPSPVDALPSDAILAEDLSGAMVAPLSTPDASAICLIFIATDCPIANAYVPEMERLQAAYGPRRVSFYLVHADDELTAAAAARHRRDFEITLPVLLDRNHVLASFSGTTMTPEAALYTPAGELVYRGRIDDLYLDFGKRRQTAQNLDLRDALDAVLAGERPERASTQAVGCFQAWVEISGHGEHADHEGSDGQHG